MQPRHYPPFAANLAFSWLAAIVWVLPVLLLAWQAIQQKSWWLSCVVLLSAVVVYRLLSGGDRPCRAIVVDYTGRLFLDFAGKQAQCRLLESSVAWPWLVCLRVCDGQDGKQSVLVWRDAVPAEVHRALRVYIAWSRSEADGQETGQKDY